MLTSGSSGNSKAVPLSHAQILNCLEGKTQVYPCQPDAASLNWIGMDHVAGLVEAHIRALWSGVDQVHVEAQDVTSSPEQYLRLLGLHKISASFAPQFLLAKIVEGVDSNRLQLPQDLDLRYLRTIASGGEALSTDVCSRFSRLLERYGAPNNVMVSGFGMTETGAGCIFHRFCVTAGPIGENQVVPVGKCVPGVEMRITPLVDKASVSANYTGDVAVGHLEIRGPIVFPGYINNDEANEASFTSDGWFRTGDMGSIDSNGNLMLTGRSKELICVNGVKYLSEDQERLIADAKIPGVVPDHVVCFAWRPSGAPTEQFCVCYQHSYETDDCAARATAQKLIIRAFLMNTGARPHVLPLPPGVLQKTTLGKISRTKVRIAFEEGFFADADALNTNAIKAVTADTLARPANSAEDAVRNIVASVLQLDPVGLGVEADYFESGVTSVDIFKIRSLVCRHFGLSSLGVETLIKYNTVRSLCQAVSSVSGGKHTQYDPVVQLKLKGTRAPLWLVHPGVGEVLVFVGLAHHIQDRPVFALRARGFEDGDGAFGSIDEVVTTYVEAIKSHQAHGPYAIAGYSYGSMLAFEISKRLECMGDSVPFLGCFNLPPHIKSRMRQLSRQNCLIHLAMFLQLISDDQSATLERESVDQPFEQVLNSVLSQADHARFCELALTRESLLRWVQVAFSLQSMAADYEPAGDVQNLDVFYCDPLTAVARSKQEWLDEQLSRWTEFCRTSPKFHSVAGAHYTMLSNAHVRGFHETLANAVIARGL